MNHHRDIDQLERLIEGDPVKNHTKIMQMLQPTLPDVIHKEYRQPVLIDDTNGDQLMPADEMIDALASALAELRSEMRDEFQDMVANATGPLTEQVAVLQGQVSVLLNLIGTIVANGNGNGNGTKSIEASEIRTTRRVRVRRGESVSQ